MMLGLATGGVRVEKGGEGPEGEGAREPGAHSAVLEAWGLGGVCPLISLPALMILLLPVPPSPFPP